MCEVLAEKQTEEPKLETPKEEVKEEVKEPEPEPVKEKEEVKKSTDSDDEALAAKEKAEEERLMRHISGGRASRNIFGKH